MRESVDMCAVDRIRKRKTTFLDPVSCLHQLLILPHSDLQPIIKRNIILFGVTNDTSNFACALSEHYGNGHGNEYETVKRRQSE